MDYASRVFFFAILLIAIGLDLLLPVVLGRYYPGYHQCLDTLSALGMPGSPVQRYARWGLITVGLLLLIFAYGQALTFASLTRWHLLYLFGIALFGMGTVLAGIFPESPPNTPQTLSGKIHGIASGIGFLFLIFNPLWAMSIREFSRHRVVHGVFFVLAVVTIALFIASKYVTAGLFRYAGLYQRLNLSVLYAHLFVNFFGQVKEG